MLEQALLVFESPAVGAQQADHDAGGEVLAPVLHQLLHVLGDQLAHTTLECLRSATGLLVCEIPVHAMENITAIRTHTRSRRLGSVVPRGEPLFVIILIINIFVIVVVSIIDVTFLPVLVEIGAAGEAGVTR